MVGAVVLVLLVVGGDVVLGSPQGLLADQVDPQAVRERAGQAWRRRRRVVDGVDLRVMRGEIVGLLGPNGAGKTTSFRITCGMTDPDRGRVFLNGNDVTDWPMFRRARDGGSRRRRAAARRTARRGADDPPGASARATSWSIGKRATNELAVMVDTFKPLMPTPFADAVEDLDYNRSWVR